MTGARVLVIWPRSLGNVDLFKGLTRVGYGDRDQSSRTADALMHASVFLASKRA
jgi:hypothetical protein